jgi:Ca-activated chloride channel family protein
MHVGGGMYQNVPVSIDEKLLKEIAELTGGRYFHAVTTEDLLAVYDTIDALEKSEIEVKAYEEREEWYPFVLLAAIGLAAIGLCGASTSWRRIP